MIEHLVKTHISWVNAQLLIIFIFSIYFLFKKRNEILNEIRNNKVIYIILLLIFVFGFWLRITNTVDGLHIFYNHLGFPITANEIADKGYASLIEEDPRIYPIILSNFVNLLKEQDFWKVGTLFNAVVSSLSLLLMFIFLRKLLNNNQVALISAVLLNFFPLFIEFSVNGWISAASIFFCLLSLVFFTYALYEDSMLLYAITGLSIGFVSQIYHIQIMLIPAILFYYLLKKGIKSVFGLRLWVTILFIILSISMFLVMQNTNTNFKEIITNPSVSRLACLWNSGTCGKYEMQDYLAGPHNYYIEDGYINRIHSKFISITCYIFLGVGSIGSYDKEWLYHGFIWNEYNYYAVNNKVNPVYIFSTILMMSAFLFYKDKRKELLLLLALLIIFMYVYYPFKDSRYDFFVEAFCLGLVPLTSAGIYVTIRKLSKGTLSILLIITLIIILISPFFSEGVYEQLKTNKNLTYNWNRLNKIIATGDETECKEIKEKRLRGECFDWIKINKAIKSSNCSYIKDYDLRLKCLPRETDVNILKEQFKLAPQKIVNATMELPENILLTYGENIYGTGMEECFDKDVFGFVCYLGNRTREVFSGKQDKGYIKRYCNNTNDECFKVSAIYDYMIYDDEQGCKSLNISLRCSKIKGIDQLMEERYNKSITSCFYHHYYFQYKCMLSGLVA